MCEPESSNSIRGIGTDNKLNMDLILPKLLLYASSLGTSIVNENERPVIQ
jgi:hypothetical protein